MECVIQCERRKKCHCCACGNFLEHLVAVLDEFKELHWFCKHCDEAVMDIIHTSDSKTLVTKTLNKALKQFNDIVIEAKNKLKKSLSEVLEQKSMENVMDVSAQSTSAARESDSTRHNIVDIVDEYADR